MANPYRPPQSSNLEGDRPDSGSEMTPRVFEVMRGTRPWVRLVGMTTLVSCAIQLLGVFRALSAGSRLGGFIIFVSLISLSMYVLLAVRLLSYSARIGDMLHTRSSLDLEAALAQHRKYWLTTGILVMVTIILSILTSVVVGMSR